MAVEIITREDLNEFQSLLLNDLKEIINSKPNKTKQWLKSNEVPQTVKHLSRTLQNRINVNLSYTQNREASCITTIPT